MTGSLKEIAKGRSDVYLIDPRVLEIKGGWNCRDLSEPTNKAHVLELKASIIELGVLTPLVVFKEDNHIYVSDGHCRLAATLLAINEGAAIASVPVKTEGRAANEADYVLRQILDGKPKTAFELGAVCKRLLGFGWTVEQIAARSGKSTSAINASLDLQGATPEVQRLVASGRVSASEAVKVVRKEGSNAAKVLNDAVDHATQRGATKATARDIGSEPKAPRKNKLALAGEIISRGYDNDLTEENMIQIMLTHDDWIELQKLLDI